jgi:hypothetical protein
LHILHILKYYLSTSAWLDQCQSAIDYKQRETAQVLNVIPVSSILGRLPIVLVGATGTIPFAMRQESADFPGAFCDKTENSGETCVCVNWYAFLKQQICCFQAGKQGPGALAVGTI